MRPFYLLVSRRAHFSEHPTPPHAAANFLLCLSRRGNWAHTIGGGGGGEGRKEGSRVYKSLVPLLHVCHDTRRGRDALLRPRAGGRDAPRSLSRVSGFLRSESGCGRSVGPPPSSPSPLLLLCGSRTLRYSERRGGQERLGRDKTPPSFLPSFLPPIWVNNKPYCSKFYRPNEPTD